MKLRLIFVLVIGLTLNIVAAQEKLLSINLGSINSGAVVYAPDDSYIFTNDGGSIKVYFSGTKNLYAEFKTKLTEINQIVSSPDGSKLYVAGKNRILKKGAFTIEVWDVKVKKQIKVIEAHDKDILALALSPNGKTLVSGGVDGILKIWSTDSLELVKELEVNAAILDIAYSPDGEMIAYGGASKSVVYRNTADFSIIKETLLNDWVRDIEFDHAGTQLASCGNDGKIYLTDIKNSFSTQFNQQLKGWLYALSFSGDDKYLAVGSSRSIVTIIDVKKNIIYKELKRVGNGTVNDLAFNKKGDQLATINSLERGLDIWDVTTLDIAPIYEFRNEDDNSPPQIYISQPAKIVNDRVRFSGDLIALKGLVLDESGVRKLKVNGINTPIKDNGNFIINLPLSPGDNYVTIEVSDINDNIALKKFVIVREDLVAGTYKPEDAKNHLFIVGVNNYENWPSLNNAVKDATDVASVLMKKYGFEFENTTIIKDEQATRGNIYKGLRSLIEKVAPGDNLFIYFSGHGYFDELLNEGYWVPADAEINNVGDYLSNSDLLKVIKNVESQHTFLVADACFSGSLFVDSNRGYAENVEQYKSRWALASGRLEVVSDGSIGQNSPFTTALIEFLQANSKEKVTASELIQYVKIKTAENSDQ
ncbi:hypothetical protein E1176_02530, partial [Fulvivirga sp. RKSG066]|uniref:caspase family protein n=1 Tax=Fulvivirga aurantia TaxID=2529383 RepID=UPI0012BD78E2